MRIRVAAGFTAIVALLGMTTTLLFAMPGLSVEGEFSTRQTWLMANGRLWAAGLWLWLLGIFSWMTLLIGFLWSYSPAHRITTMLQSGLMIIGAVLAIAGVVTWMSGLAVAGELTDARPYVTLIDALALGLLGAGCFMGGAVTTWIALDLAQLRALSWSWLLPFILAGLFVLPAPFLLPTQPWFVVAGVVLWAIGALHLAFRRNIPHAYTEWS